MSHDLSRSSSASRNRKIGLGMLLSAAIVTGATLAARNMSQRESADAASPSTPAARPSVNTPRTMPAGSTRPKEIPAIVAVVNGEQITRGELGRECLRHYGQEVLEQVVNKHLIAQECKRAGIEVTRDEVSREIETLAERFGTPVDQWLKVLKLERGVGEEEYADIIWTTLALRKLAGSRLTITREELQREFESRYGAMVKVRMIVCDDVQTAESVRARAAANPEDFAKLATTESTDGPSASLGGMIPLIRQHVGDPKVTQAAFMLREGEVSQVLPLMDRFTVLKCEAQMAPRRVSYEQVKLKLAETLRETKMRAVAGEVFLPLQKNAQIINVLNDPARRQQMPGVAAVINGQKVTEGQLAAVCIQRHGEEVLEGTINRRLLEQACRRSGVTVTAADVDAEIARAANIYVQPKPDGSPDIQVWLDLVTKRQGVSEEVYRRDSVWPSVALKKLVGDRIEVTDEDRRLSYENNYGPRVRCLAIVFNDLRRAQRVWEMARAKSTNEYFGELASQYSIEPQSQSLRGEMPPIQKHGGRPKLEEVAFAMQPGQLSDIVELRPNQYVILKCVGLTQPTNVKPEEVRQLIEEDVHEKKLRLGMADYFQKLVGAAHIDNHLTGDSIAPRVDTRTSALTPR